MVLMLFSPKTWYFHNLINFFSICCINLQSDIIYSPTLRTSADVADVPCPTPLYKNNAIREMMPCKQRLVIMYTDSGNRFYARSHFMASYFLRKLYSSTTSQFQVPLAGILHCLICFYHGMSTLGDHAKNCSLYMMNKIALSESKANRH